MKPVLSTLSGVSLMAYNPALAAGITIEPSSSVPSDTGAKPAATPAALPEDEPPGPYPSVSEILKLEMGTDGVCEEWTILVYTTFDVGILRLINSFIKLQAWIGMDRYLSPHRRPASHQARSFRIA